MLQREKVCYWSQYSSCPHILQGASAQCIRHSCYPGRLRGWLDNKVEKGHLKSFSSLEQYGGALRRKQNFTLHNVSPQHHLLINKHLFYTGKMEGCSHFVLSSKFFFSQWLAGAFPTLRVCAGEFSFISSSSNSRFNYHQLIKAQLCLEKSREPGNSRDLCNGWLIWDSWDWRFEPKQEAHRKVKEVWCKKVGKLSCS